MRQPLSRSRFGLCLFDDPCSPDGGWAMESFGTPRYVRGTGDLRSDTTWLTNIDSNTFYQMGLSRTPRLRSDAFLRTKLSSIIMELGLSDLPPRERTALLCQMFTAMMDFAFIDFGIKTAPSIQLNNGIRQVALPSEEALDHAVKYAAMGAWQTHVYCEKALQTNESQLVSFVFHRQSYARDMCSQPLPVGPWEMYEGDYPKGAVDFIEWLDSMERPALAEITIEHLHESINALVNYGAGAGYTTSAANRGATITFNDRRWMTSVELRALCPHASITIHNVILGREFASSPVGVPRWDPQIQRSYAFGLYCENLWTSLTRTLDGKSSKSPLAAWMHSLDRIFCLKKCEQLVHEEGFTIHGYGYGRITVQADKEQLLAMPHVALRLGLIAPAPDPENIVKRSVSPGQTMLELTQLIIERRAHDLISKMDAIAIDKAHQHAAASTRPSLATRQII